jgi:two-component system chemotaxis sensor kinase CheA
MDELLEQFLIEGRELVADAQGALAQLRGDGADARAIDAAFRAFHTLKGSVALFDLLPAERVLHAGEDLLAEARKHGTGFAVEEIVRLIAIVDQVDRWIDDLERDGGLGADAGGKAAALLGDGASVVADEPEDMPPLEGDASLPGWSSALAERHGAALDAHEGPLAAFRYMPDREAFFRGEDPLALVGAVPGLLVLDILPPDEGWAPIEAYEPFACMMAIEGVSGVSVDALRQAFRLAPDQVAFAALPARVVAANSEATQAIAATSIRVDARRIDALAEDVGELVVAAHAMASLAERAQALDPGFALDIRAGQASLERAVGRISRSVSEVRLVSLAPTLARLPRMVREIAAGLGKTVDFTVSGEQIEVDKQIVDGLFEPLLHLLRNAIDHGIEAADIRTHAGKPAEGKLALTVVRDGDGIMLSLSDDGAGIDRARVRATAVGRGLIDAETAEALSDAGALALIFLPGFSTAAMVTGVSGRGVGMDAVQAAVERLRGRIEIDSVAGEGTCFRLRFPANAITTRLLVVEAGRDRYAVPFEQIAETVRVDAGRLVPLGTGIACVLRDRTVPVLSLAGLLGSEESGSLSAKLLVTEAGGEPVAIRVDAFHERIDAMVRPPSRLLTGVPMVSGTTVLGDGTVLLVLNMAELVA